MSTKLEVTMPSEREIRVTRAFNAPPGLVFECHTQPELIKRWLLGPPGWIMPICEIDLRAGGRYRYVWRSTEKSMEFGVQGQFREVLPPHRMVNVETMDGVQGETLCTTTFAGSGNGTLLTLTMQFELQVLRDAALESGMTGGMSMSYDRLDDIAKAERP
jgi:uncharacterized protein YndB with AHSA1/START domain